jgi:hypothetical protein
MPTRREFLTSASVTLLMIPLGACSSSSSPAAAQPADGSAGGGPDTGVCVPGSSDGSTCSGVSTTSTTVSEHTHTLCVPDADLTSPPSAGATYTSSCNLDPLNDIDHIHNVTLSALELSTINGGGTVTVTSTEDDLHTHQFAIVKAA